MKIIQWSMTVPAKMQKAFVKWFWNQASPMFSRFGAQKHEIYKVSHKQILGKQTIEKNRFVERVYFDESFDLQTYFTKVKSDERAWETSRKYESEFGATNIELKILEEV